MKREKAVISFTLILIFSALAYKAYSNFIDNLESSSYNDKVNQSPCVSDWHKCKNLNQLFNEYEKISNFEYDCKYLAEDKLEFGPPVWKGFPYKSFSSHYTSTPFLKTGYIVLVETQALIPNQFGGKEHKQLDCYVDLEAGKPDKIIIPN